MADETEHHEEEALNQGKKPGADKPSHDSKPENGQEKREGFADPLEFLNAELERAEAEKAEYHDKMVRLAAEMDNLRKRTAKDVADARQYSIASFAREMLSVSDNLRRALDAVPDESREAGDAGLNALIEGVELTERSMLQALEKSNVKRISPKGERFDPNFHQAMFEVPNAEVPHNSVIEVVQDGYVIGERVLRPAMVGVAKGGPKQVKPDAESGTDEGEAQEAENTSGES